MTMKELAREAGVAKSTVSKAFSFSSEISEETRERIFALARAHGVYDKFVKRTPQKPVIAVICPEFEGGLYARQLSLLEKEISRRGAIMIASCCSFDPNVRRELLAYYTECVKADGVILYESLPLDGKLSTPIVTIGNSDFTDSVCLSSVRAIDDAIRHLKENGHRDIGLITEPLTASQHAMFREAMEKNGIPVNEAFLAESTLRFEAGGYEAMEKLFAADTLPTALFITYDDMARGAIRCILDHGCSVPEDFSIISQDDSTPDPYMNVPLSSITSDNEDLCQIIVDTLFDRIKADATQSPKKILVSRTLVKRASVAEAKQKT